jgi:hypothetical protein
MADAIHDEALKLTVGTVTAFLNAAGARIDCPMCGNKGWEMVEPASVGVANVAIAQGAITIGQKTMMQVLLTCAKCAFVRAHSARMIADWSLKQKNGGTT